MGYSFVRSGITITLCSLGIGAVSLHAKDDASVYSVFYPGTGMQQNMTTQHWPDNFDEVYKREKSFSGSNGCLFTAGVVRFGEKHYFKFDYGYGITTILDALGAGDGWKTEKDGPVKLLSSTAGPGQDSTVMQKYDMQNRTGSLIFPRIQWGWAFGERIVHGPGFNFNFRSAGSEGMIDRVELGIQYQLQFPVGDKLNINPSYTFNGVVGSGDPGGYTTQFETDVLYRVLPNMSVLLSYGLESLNYEWKEINQQYEDAGEDLVRETNFSVNVIRLAAVFHNIPLFGRQLGDN